MMTSRHKVPVMAAVVLALTAGLGGCGGKKSGTVAGGSSTTPASAPASSPAATAPATKGQGGGGGPGACHLISTAEAAQLAKTAVQPGVEKSLPAAPGITASYCTYAFQPGNAPAVLIAVYKAAPSVLAQARQADASESDFQEVSGVGDEAHQCCGGNLKVRVGDTGLVLSIGQRNGVAGDTPLDDLKRLAADLPAMRARTGFLMGTAP